MRNIIFFLLGIYLCLPAGASPTVNPPTNLLITSFLLPDNSFEEHLNKRKKLSAKKGIFLKLVERKLKQAFFRNIDEKKVRKNGYVAMTAGFIAIICSVLLFVITTWNVFGFLLFLLFLSTLVAIISSILFFVRRKKIKDKTSARKHTGIVAIISILVAAIIAAFSISYQLGGL